jgi:hypothetical protein
MLDCPAVALSNGSEDKAMWWWDGRGWRLFSWFPMTSTSIEHLAEAVEKARQAPPRKDLPEIELIKVPEYLKRIYAQCD